MTDVQESYRILGILPGATLDEAKAAWRLRAQQFHPDRLQLAPPDERAAAERQFKELSEAWRVVREHLGESGPQPWPFATPAADSDAAGPTSGANEQWDAIFASQKRPGLSKRTLTFIGVAIACVVALFGYRTLTKDDKPDKYVLATQTSILDSCQANGTSVARCRCVLDDLMQTYSEDEFHALIKEFQETQQVPPELAAVGANC